MSAKTVEAYERDARQFLIFLAEHMGGAPTLAALATLLPQDVRAFMAARRADGIGGRSLMRALAGVRSFAHFLERNGKGKVAALAAVRAPKVPKTLPKPLHVTAAKRITDADLRAGEAREPWILARDAAVLALLYGSGLRISEALGLERADVPAPGKGDAISVIGKGSKQRMVPMLPQVSQLIADYVALCPYDLPASGPLFVGARGKISIAAHRATGDGASARHARSARLGDAARAASFLRHASAGPRRRSPRHPGAVGPRFALDHADLHGRRLRPPARSLSQRAPASVIQCPRRTTVQ